MTATLNGRPQRKQLSDQLDRLDVMIDCLSEALPQAVADATREGSRQAVREVLTELFGNSETLAKLRESLSAPSAVPQSETPSVATTVTAKPGFFARMKSGVQNAAAAVITKVKQAFAAVKARVQIAKARVTAAIQTVKNVVPLGRFAAIALVVGVLVAGVSYVAPQGFSAVVSGIGAVVITGAVQTYRWLRRSARSVGLLA
jgi:hypothetical protein